MKSRQKLRISAVALGILCVGAVGGILVEGGAAGHGAKLLRAFNQKPMPSNTWESGPIQSTRGDKTLVAQFRWGGGYSMHNSENYAVTWFDDAAGHEQVGESQFGQGTAAFQTQVLQVLAPYYELEAKNVDAVAPHTLDAWAYLMPN